uniref:probable serine/threonine-protein kinase yakA isoform X2 n=1 Tax=Gasterosteus aculeatus aculeatus TaxID=481459 RepID=UPI001A98D671|nr:probable serine/threonine-protein kinase yakA isoform X2 [Gasterosteus aculeatus aculeatus]
MGLIFVLGASDVETQRGAPRDGDMKTSVFLLRHCALIYFTRWRYNNNNNNTNRVNRININRTNRINTNRTNTNPIRREPEADPVRRPEMEVREGAW